MLRTAENISNLSGELRVHQRGEMREAKGSGVNLGVVRGGITNFSGAAYVGSITVSFGTWEQRDMGEAQGMKNTCIETKQ